MRAIELGLLVALMVMGVTFMVVIYNVHPCSFDADPVGCLIEGEAE